MDFDGQRHFQVFVVMECKQWVLQVALRPAESSVEVQWMEQGPLHLPPDTAQLTVGQLRKPCTAGNERARATNTSHLFFFEYFPPFFPPLQSRQVSRTEEKNFKKRIAMQQYEMGIKKTKKKAAN